MSKPPGKHAALMWDDSKVEPQYVARHAKPRVVYVPDPPEPAQSFAERQAGALRELMHDLTVGVAEFRRGAL